MSVFIFILGLIIGSFLNVIIYRLPKNKSIISPPSHCPACGTWLKPFDLVPILSFLLSRGKCRYCGVKISWQYPVVELLTGLLFLSIYVKYGIGSNSIVFLVLVSLLIIISFIDLKYKIIPNKITYPGMIAGLLIVLIFNHLSFMSALLGLIIPGGSLLLIALLFKKGMGMGDVKLVAMIGTFIGWKYTLLGLFLGSLIGLLISIILIILGKAGRKTQIPFGPYISIGTLIIILWGEKIISFYLNLYR